VVLEVLGTWGALCFGVGGGWGVGRGFRGLLGFGTLSLQGFRV